MAQRQTTSPPPLPHIRRPESPSLSPTSPSSTPSPSTSAGAAGSASSAAASSAEFIADAGPAFDPDHAPAAPEVDDVDELGDDEGWDEQKVQEFVVMQGEITHSLFNAGPEDDETWLHTERDLRAIVPPLTRILNRYDMTRAAAAAGDEALLAAAVARYGARNYTKRRKYLALRAAQGPAPITGAAAPPETGPEHDPDWQRVHGPAFGEQLDDSPPDLPPRGGHQW